jgi:hypothetical protein
MEVSTLALQDGVSGTFDEAAITNVFSKLGDLRLQLADGEISPNVMQSLILETLQKFEAFLP